MGKAASAWRAGLQGLRAQRSVRGEDSSGAMELEGVPGFPSIETFAQVAEAGVSSPPFMTLCSWLVSELRSLCKLEEDVSPVQGPEDAETFQIEISGLLGELHCPYPSLTTGDLMARLSARDSRLQLLYFLSSELLAARLQARKTVQSAKQVDKNSAALRELHQICQALGMPEPDPASSVAQVMEDIGSQVSEALAVQTLQSQWPPPLLKAPLTSEQWEALEEINQVLGAEYRCRRHMMLTRFDVTVASFHWSERAKNRSTAMSKAFQPLRQSLPEDAQLGLAHLLAAREDFSRIVKTSSGALRSKTSCAVNKVLMTGSVPDRGGRPNEIEPPMPTWEKRRDGGGGGGGGGQRWAKRGKKKKK
ncbi:protein FAM98C isoform X1 [Crotalus tigris]|uniref:protein FAM98C isoform X1 n=2 Tax=Crotalus tigris TaxID=88082 RepID=UPI00192F2937|nr:protein FAM98C isoform X1 [Crotalus tigris]